MRKLLMTLALVAFVTTLSFARIPIQASEGERMLNEEMASAVASLEQGDNSVFKDGNGTSWRNGDYECSVVSCIDEKDRVSHLGFITDPRGENLEGRYYYEVKLVKGAPRVLNHKGVTVKHQKIGCWDLIVFRNASGGVLDVLIGSDDRVRQENLMRDRQAMFNGVWVSARGDTATLGRPVGERYGLCPGDYELEEVENGLQLLFAHDRMKVVRMPDLTKKEDPQTGIVTYYGDGNPISKEEYEFILSRPCGYGGHGALLGPIAWGIKPSADYQKIDVNLITPFDKSQDFRYSPFDEAQFTLSWVRSFYPDMKGRWAVASMRPLTRRMLASVDKAGLRAILADIASRHPKGTALTAIEKLNKSLVTTMLGEK